MYFYLINCNISTLSLALSLSLSLSLQYINNSLTHSLHSHTLRVHSSTLTHSLSFFLSSYISWSFTYQDKGSRYRIWVAPRQPRAQSGTTPSTRGQCRWHFTHGNPEYQCLVSAWSKHARHTGRQLQPPTPTSHSVRISKHSTHSAVNLPFAA